MNYWTQNKDNIYVAAHRGFCSDYPENTMLAFKKALEVGVDQLETDVRVTKDDELVLIHDSTVDRTTDGSGKVCDFTLEELKKLDAGRGERIPTFVEFMDYIKDHPTITLDIELKAYPHEVGDKAYEVADRVLKLVDDYGFADRVVINTFSAQLHEYIAQKYAGKYRQHVYFPSTVMKKIKRDPLEYAYCCCMFMAFYSEVNMATEEEFDVCASRGVQPWAGACVKDEKTVDMAIERGATLITCNNPDVVLDILRKRGKHK